MHYSRKAENKRGRISRIANEWQTRNCLPQPGKQTNEWVKKSIPGILKRNYKILEYWYAKRKEK